MANFVFGLEFVRSIAVDLGECIFECDVVVTKGVIWVVDYFECPIEGFFPKVGGDKQNALFIRSKGIRAEGNVECALCHKCCKVGRFPIEGLGRRNFGVAVRRLRWLDAVGNRIAVIGGLIIRGFRRCESRVAATVFESRNSSKNFVDFR